MAEMYGKLEGCCRGRGGSMHLFDRATPVLRRQRDRRRRAAARRRAGARPTRCRAASASPPASSATARSPKASSTRAMNLAALWRLPVLFVCENNLYAMGTALERAESETGHPPQGRRPTAFRARWSTAWTSSRSKRRRGGRASSSAAAAGPTSSSAAPTASARIRCSTPQLYRDKEEIEAWKRSATRSSASRAGSRRTGCSTQTTSRAIEAEVAAEVEAAVAFAEAGTLGAGRGARALRHDGRGAGMTEADAAVGIDLSRGLPAGDPRGAPRAIRASS